MSADPTRLVVASPYGVGQAGYRERVEAWVRRLDLDIEPHCYFGDSGTASGLGVRGIARSARREAGLRRLRRRGPRHMLIHREASPFSTGRIEADLLGAAEGSAYDIDDALHADWGGDRMLRRVFAKAGKAAACVERASITIAGNDHLAEWAATLADDVRVVPTCVEPADYEPRPDHDLHEPPRILWIGSPSTVRHLRLIEAPLLRLHADLGARLVVIGGSVADSPLAAMAIPVSWSPENQRRWLADADLGVMPLSDDAFERGKCGYKLLQYGAAGLPAVASPVGANATILERFGAPVATTDDDWFEAMRALLTGPASQREALAKQARAAVDEHYSFASHEPAWRELVDDLGLGRRTEQQDRSSQANWPR
jgi:glycosyltransferase involved in cell wall biosynthesis